MSHPQEPSVEGQIYFYPPEYYVFDNFSSFQIEYKGKNIQHPNMHINQ